MKNQVELKFEIFKLLYAVWNPKDKSIHQIAIDSGINPFTMHQMASGHPVCWRHYFKLLNYYGYDLEIKLIKKDL